MEMLKTDPAAVAPLLGMSVADLPSADDPSGLMGIMDTVQAAALTMAINEGWLALGLICLVALPVLYVLGPIRSALPMNQIAQSENW